MISKIRNIFKIEELRKKIFYTLAILFVFRLVAHVPVPGIDSAKLASYFAKQASNNFLGLLDVFAGGALRRATILALGIMPYISASIIFQLLTAVIPALEKLSKEGELGRKKINQYTRYATVVITLVQSFALTKWLNSQGFVPNYGWGFIIQTMLTMTAGTMFLLWLGERISKNGIGNGVSMIIFAGIVARLPNAAIQTYGQVFVLNQMNVLQLIFILAMMVGVVLFVVLIQEGQRKIPVRYPKRVVGRKMTMGQSTYLPLRVNQAGVIPIIFASSILMFPGTLAQFAGGNQNSFLAKLAVWFAPGSTLYVLVYITLIVFFTYFYTAITMNPRDVADNLKKSGGFIPGVRPGEATSEHINYILNRIALPGALFLASIAILPIILSQQLNIPFAFGGTSVLISVGVGLDTVKKIESHLLMRHYDGFTKKGRLGSARR
ncbi:MAG: preprotein translocase subunit SecY [Candidatus Mcinerneyibacterium aminivorans]|uniref:Protein translocase subunit SecY n=1 Tax=Candidatus Mcinerneyibacterium aminivorans TaxID=2703815 RepID=A0A5D0MI97_9BACT|nr:MAG: preprotein translocase subunit SecY [Candidatus Mcinerneyibacterium aminivorans]